MRDVSRPTKLQETKRSEVWHVIISKFSATWTYGIVLPEKKIFECIFAADHNWARSGNYGTVLPEKKIIECTLAAEKNWTRSRTLENSNIHDYRIRSRSGACFRSLGRRDGAEKNEYQATDLLRKWCSSSDGTSTSYCLGDQEFYGFRSAWVLRRIKTAVKNTF